MPRYLHYIAFAALYAVGTAMAQTAPGRLDVGEAAQAQTECNSMVTRHCLYILALDAVTRPNALNNIRMKLSQIVISQARAGDIAGAERSLTFGSVDPSVFLHLGRWDEAYALAQQQFPNTIVEFGSPDGSFKKTLVNFQLEKGQIDLALQSALSIAGSRNEQSDALHQIVLFHLGQNHFAEALALAKMIEPAQARDRSYLAISQAQANSGLFSEAAATLYFVAQKWQQSNALLTLAAAQYHSGDEAGASASLASAVMLARTALQGHEHGLDNLIDAANLALDFGLLTEARTYATLALEPAYKINPGFADPGQVSALEAITLTRIATILALAGAPDDADAAFRTARLPLADSASAMMAYQVLCHQLVAAFRLHDQTAIEAAMSAIDTANPISQQRNYLEAAAIELIAHGFLTEAQMLADYLDRLQYGGGWSADVYAALLDADPSLAPTLLSGVRTPFVRVQISANWAETLRDQGRETDARSLLVALPDWIATLPSTEFIPIDQRTNLFASVATSQSDLGFDDDARATLQRAYRDSQGFEHAFSQLNALLIIADALKS